MGVKNEGKNESIEFSERIYIAIGKGMGVRN